MNLNIDWNHIVTASILLVILIILRMLLDMRIAVFVVKYFHFLPMRRFFRERPVSIEGKWRQIWSIADHSSFAEEDDRYSAVKLRQFGRYCYGEFRSDNRIYCVFGKITHGFFHGEWYDKKDEMGYFGTFQLIIVDERNMNGKWIGHSKFSAIIQEDNWVWHRQDKMPEA
jgi:hypothetical protein